MILSTITALVGGSASFTAMEPFGYVNPMNFCGYVQGLEKCNNPNYNLHLAGQWNILNDPEVAESDTFWHMPQWDERARSMLLVHGWMTLELPATGGTIEVIHDATMGPVVMDPNQTPSPHSAPFIVGPGTGQSALQVYLNTVLDLSHTQTASWEDNLEIAIDWDYDWGTPQMLSWELNGHAHHPTNDDLPNPDYKNGDASRAAVRAFAVK